jgi:hypothetical protein
LKLVDFVTGVIEPELCAISSGDMTNDGDITTIDVIELVYLVMGF